MIDSAVLSQQGACATIAAPRQKSCDLAVRPLLALRDGGTSRSAEVVVWRALAGAWGLTSAWR